MRLLIDTHVAIWSSIDSRRLPDHVVGLLADPTNEIHVSAVSLWELATKRRQGGRDVPCLSASQARLNFVELGYEILPVTADHAIQLEEMPLIHRDPFDRLLVAQALTEPMRLVTRDRKLAAYSDTVITW